MEFSVLMSVYYKDNPQWLKEAVDSVMNNTIKPNEILIGIDGQIPQELEEKLQQLCNEYGQIKLAYFKENRGRGALLHDTLPMTNYPLVAIMDSDDICYSDRFEKQLSVFKQEKDLDILGAFIEEFDEDTKKIVSVRKVPLEEDDIKKYIKTRNPINQVTVMFKKECILKIGGYPSNMRVGEDYLLWVRAIVNNLKLKNLSDVLVKVRINSDMFARRGGYSFYKANKDFLKEMLKLKIINYPFYLYNIYIRFVVQVLMPNSMRTLFYKKFLR